MEEYDYGRLLVLGHYDEPRLAGIEQMLVERATRRPWDLVSAPNGVPDHLDDDVRGVLVMGGMMGVPELGEMPWMQDEVDLLRAAHEQGTPILGVCLGAQLLGHALGGEVTRRDVPEIGLFGLQRTDEGREDEIFGGWPDGGRVALTHRDDVSTLPPGAVSMLAPAGEPAAAGTPAWRVGETTYAVQFHPEISPDLLRFWIEVGFDDAIRAAGVEPDDLVAQVEAEARFLRAVGLAFVGRWIDFVVGKGDPSPRKHRKAA